MASHLGDGHAHLAHMGGSAPDRCTTKLKLNNDTSEPIKIQRGIFQGDGLSPLWFCLALNPLSNVLNDTRTGFHFQNCDTKLNHLMYMDDIKLYANNESDLNILAETTDRLSKDMCMDFGIDKCRINSVKEGKSFEHHFETMSHHLLKMKPINI